MSMKVFVFSHEGEWLTAYTAVVAHTQEEARATLVASWEAAGRKGWIDPGDAIVIDPQQSQVVEIWDGDY